MQLKRLEAYGFKSFADKIEIEFDHGITAIVGPNGSGKSNITDAIRWVLGEQNVRNLRGTKAEDIIFTGSAARKALGVAEVSLVFENQGDMGVDFKEVVVTRRLFRSGESEFYINRARCRLKDIYNLFADTGIGHDGMSIIGQNRIDDILNSKPEDRRAFFEETAGITKYRNRKRETLKKLEDTENNLVRVGDIRHEIEIQLEPLAENAEKTRIYNDLNGQYQRVRLTSLHQEHEKLSGILREAEARKQEISDQAIAFRTEVQKADARKEQLSKEVIDIEQAMQAKSEENESVRTELEAVSSQMATLRERQEQSGANRARILSRREELSREIEQEKQEIGTLGDSAQKQQEDLKLTDDLLAEERKKSSEIAKRIQSQKELSKKCDEALQARRAELAEKQKELALIEHDIESQEGGREERELSLQAMRQDLAAMEQEEERLKGELETGAGQEAALAKQQAERQEQQRERQQALSGTQKAERDTQQELRSMESKLQFLQRVQHSYEGFGRAAKAVLKSNESWRKGICGAVAELIRIPKEYVTAIEIALGGNLQNIITEDTDTAKAAISFLKREKQGRVTFLPLSTIVVREGGNEDILKEQGVIGYANRLAETDAKYRKAVDFLLSRTLVMDTLDHALALAKKQGYRMRIVTLEGELLNPGGSLSGGSRQHKEASFLSRIGEMEELRQKIGEAQKLWKELSEKRQRQAQELETCEAELAELSEKLQAEHVHLAELRVSLQAASEALQAKQQEVQGMERQESKQQESFAQIQKKRVLLSREADALAKAVSEAEQKAQDEAVMLEDFEQDAEDLDSYLQDREIKRAILEQQVKQNQEKLQMHRDKLQKDEEQLQRNLQEEQELESSLRRSDSELAEIRQKNEILQQRYDAGQEEQKRLYTQKMEKLTEHAEAEKEAQKNSQKLNGMEKKLHEVEISMSRTQYSLQDCEENMLQGFGLTPERAAEEAEDVPPEEISGRLKELSKKIEELGAVNPNALHEYEEMKKRHEFLEKQSNDLVEAKDNLMSILGEMDAEMTAKFQAAFADIQTYFGEIFVRLFGGGKAELELLDKEDVLNTGVEILVQLPQKKRQNLSALSGGERALTVIALLFAFLKYRPSPFSVLDEIDAPLDEANVVRFGSFLREFSQSTQFIVVTHRKSTMESVDRMYGVTIEDAGVSRILSVKLDEVE